MIYHFHDLHSIISLEAKIDDYLCSWTITDCVCCFETHVVEMIVNPLHDMLCECVFQRCVSTVWRRGFPQVVCGQMAIET